MRIGRVRFRAAGLCGDTHAHAHATGDPPRGGFLAGGKWSVVCRVALIVVKISMCSYQSAVRAHRESWKVAF